MVFQERYVLVQDFMVKGVVSGTPGPPHPSFYLHLGGIAPHRTNQDFLAKNTNMLDLLI